MGSARRSVPMPRRALRAVFGDRAGVAMIEFALTLPLVTFAIFGICAFGTALSNYVDLAEGVRATGRVLAQASAYPSAAYNNGKTYFAASTANLTQANLTLTVAVNGTTCGSATACDNALAAATGGPVTVTGTYTVCIVVMGVNFFPSCSLTATTTQMVE